MLKAELFGQEQVHLERVVRSLAEYRRLDKSIFKLPPGPLGGDRATATLRSQSHSSQVIGDRVQSTVQLTIQMSAFRSRSRNLDSVLVQA